MNFAIERQRDHFNAIAERYEVGRRDVNHRRVKALIWKSALTCLAHLKGRRIRMLEPMCGYAEGLEIVRDHAGLDCDYSGFDYSDVVVDALSQSFSGGKVWQADATTFRPKPTSFDLMVLIGGLHHVPDSAGSVVSNLAAGLKPGGVFVSFEPTHGNAVFKYIREKIYRSNSIFDEKTEKAFAVDELFELFRSAGMEPVHVSYPGLLAYILYYNSYAFPWLNRGGKKAVNAAFAIDRLFMNNWIGRTLSFATVSIWCKRG